MLSSFSHGKTCYQCVIPKCDLIRQASIIIHPHLWPGTTTWWTRDKCSRHGYTGHDQDHHPDHRYAIDPTHAWGTPRISPHAQPSLLGANQGVGFETARILALGSSSYHIILGSRTLSKGEAAAKKLQALAGIKGTVAAIQLDVTHDASVDAAATAVEAEHGRLDVLVNNAGIFRHGPTPRAAAREIFETNVVGYISVTEVFLPLLQRSAGDSHAPRLVFVSSSTGSITHASDPNSRYYAAAANEYRAGNAARNMLMNQYWVRLQKEGFKVFGADPGLTATNFVDPAMTRSRGTVEPEVGGEGIAYVVRGDRDADVGRVCGEYGVSPW